MNIGMNLVQQSSFSVILLNYIFFHNIYIEHASTDGHLGCFQAVAIVNSAAISNGIHVPFSILVSSRNMPRSGIAGSYGGFISSF